MFNSFFKKKKQTNIRTLRNGWQFWSSLATCTRTAAHIIVTSDVLEYAVVAVLHSDWTENNDRNCSGVVSKLLAQLCVQSGRNEVRLLHVALVVLRFAPLPEQIDSKNQLP